MNESKISLKQATAIMQTWKTGHFKGKGNGEVKLVIE